MPDPGSGRGGADPAEALRAAVARTFQATVGQADVTRERAQELVDDLADAAGRVRSTLSDLRVATGEDVRSLRNEIAKLDARIAALERKPSSKTKKGT